MDASDRSTSYVVDRLVGSLIVGSRGGGEQE